MWLLYGCNYQYSTLVSRLVATQGIPTCFHTIMACFDILQADKLNIVEYVMACLYISCPTTFTETARSAV